MYSRDRPFVLSLMSFLIHYSVCDSSGLDLTVLFESKTIKELADYVDLRFFKRVGTYKNDLRLLLLNSQTTQSSEVQQNVLTPAFHGPLASSHNKKITQRNAALLGLVLDSQLRSARPTSSLEIAELTVEDWKSFIGTRNSTFLMCVKLLLSAGRDNSDNEKDVTTSVLDDLELLATLGQAMIFRGSYSKSYAIFAQCVQEIWMRARKDLQIVMPEIFYISTIELIKCCNIIRFENLDLLWAVKQSHYLKYLSYLSRSFWDIGLADWFIGWGDYSTAEWYLGQSVYGAETSDYLRVIANLRLNKVRRRMMCLDESTFKKGGPLFKALSLVDHTNTDMSNECLDELYATMAFTRWHGRDVSAIAKTVLAANTTRPEKTWRLEALEDQCEGMKASILGLQDKTAAPPMDSHRTSRS